MKKYNMQNLLILTIMAVVLLMGVLTTTTLSVGELLNRGYNEHVVVAFPAVMYLVMYNFISKSANSMLEELFIGSLHTIIPFLYGVYYIYGRGPVETYVPSVGILLIITSGIILIVTSFKLLARAVERVLNKENVEEIS